MEFVIENSCYIDGKWVRPASAVKTVLIDPKNAECLGYYLGADQETTRLAIDAAHRAATEKVWAHTELTERKRVLYQIAQLLEENAEEIAQVESLNQGMPVAMAREDVAVMADLFRLRADQALLLYKEEEDDAPDTKIRQIRLPIGVCGILPSWNYPFFVAANDVCKALAAGNCVVVKPAEITPLSCMKFFALLDQSDLPKGVANLVAGKGRIVGNELAENPKVKRISLVGSTETGKHILRAASATIKSVVLEMGGKNPFLIFADADLEAAVAAFADSAFANSGQLCVAPSRLLVHESMREEVERQLVSRLAEYRIGSGQEPETTMGPLVGKEHYEKVVNFLDGAQREGGTLLCGGKKPVFGNALDQGYFLEPTVIRCAHSDLEIWREEVFGPVVILREFADDEEALRLANDSRYGLVAGFFTTDSQRIQRFRQELEAGIVYVNGYGTDSGDFAICPHKDSGYGSDGRFSGLEQYTKSVIVSESL